MKPAEAVRRSFVAGLILVTPLVVTLFVVRTLVVWSLQVVDPVAEGTRLAQYTGNNEPLAQLAAAGLIVVVVTGLGYLTQWSLGRHVFGNVGRAVHVVPLVSTIYSSVRQVATALVERNAAYESVVLVEYPREGVYSLGLVTGDSPAAVEEYLGEPAYNVFLPNSPNPTGGRLVVLPAEEVHEVDMSVRRGLQLLVTTGVGDDRGLPAAGDEVAASPPGGR